MNDVVLHLNQLALDLVAGDFSKPSNTPPSNGGPTRTARALAIIHLAMYDAYGIFTGAFTPKVLTPPAVPTDPTAPTGFAQTDENIALVIGAAAFHACKALYPDQPAVIAASISTFGPLYLPPIVRPVALSQFGEDVAQAWLDQRKTDNADKVRGDKDSEYISSLEPGAHREDPFHPGQGYHGKNWGNVKPFILVNAATDAPLGKPFPAFPSLNDPAYAKAYNKVVVFGRDNTPLKDSAFRQKAEIGIFWGYDGSNKLGTPPRLYNQVVREVAIKLNANVKDKVRLFAAINAAMADAAIACWHWKYVYNFWRPVLGIREADKGWGWGAAPAGDGNPITVGNSFWSPLGAPKSNPPSGASVGSDTSDFTPNFPAYPSGHATFGAACFEVAAGLFGKKPKDITVSFVSDEFNGTTTDSHGAARPRLVRTFNLQEAIDENKISRIYLGVHWDFDAEGGDFVGSAVAKKVLAKF